MIFYNAEDFERFINADDENTIIGVTSGCFDILHPLHVEYLNKCRRQCNKLYVFIDSDRLVYENKREHPSISENDRAYMVDNLACVSSVLIIDKLIEMSDVIRGLTRAEERFIYVFKNSNSIYGTKLMEYGPGTENIIIPDTKRFQSSTDIKNSLKQSNG